MITFEDLAREAVLRIGEVVEVSGRKIFIEVDGNKNLSDLILDGDLLKSISVNSHIEVQKGFISLIGRVEGEKVVEDSSSTDSGGYEKRDKNKRILTVSLSGFINRENNFIGGMREMPLVGNEAYLLTKEKLHTIYKLAKGKQISIKIAKSESDEIDVSLPVDGLFNGHIAIFGNTGSGKSNTLAHLYQDFISESHGLEKFKKEVKFVLYDFNGEYIRENCITTEKHVYNLNTSSEWGGDRIPMKEEDFMDPEILGILLEATDKTQKPFIKRALSLYRRENKEDYFKKILNEKIKKTLLMSDKNKVYLVIDYFRQILMEKPDENIISDLEWHNKVSTFMYYRSNEKPIYLNNNEEDVKKIIEETCIYKKAGKFNYPDSFLEKFKCFLYLQLASDVLSDRAQNDHIAPVISRLKSKRRDIDKIFEIGGSGEFWNDNNFIIVNLDKVNLEMKKTVPLLLSKKLYLEHKKNNAIKSLTLIIDEAHNILSKESFRESESWKDYRLETFEEIIKEGRKFGVFVTISSQRPNDISATITSQVHNYFIHRLVNQKDLATISNVVSYIDKVTEESIPVLPIGTCIFSGLASPLPIKLAINSLNEEKQPKSHTLSFEDIIKCAKKDISDDLLEDIFS